MTDFPSESDLFWLLSGLVPIAWLIYRAWRGGISEFATLGSIVLMSLWLGYHLTPWLAVPHGGWDSWLLRPDYVTDGIRYATLSMWTFFIAYASWARAAQSRTSAESVIGRVNVQEHWISIGCAVVVIAVLVHRGGPIELLWSSQPRGAGQFESRDLVGSLDRILGVFLAPTSFVLSLLASLYISAARNSTMLLHRLPLGVIGLFVASVDSFFNFGRGAGFACFVLAVMLIATRGTRAVLPAAFAVTLGVWLGLVGYSQRSVHMPGVANYLGAVIAPDMDLLRSTLFGLDSVGAPTEGGIDPTANVFNALDPWTTKAWTLERVDHDVFDGLLGVFELLQPLPSEFVSFRTRAGESLTVVLGTWGQTGITTPALAELYYLLGDAGLIFVVGFGLLAAWAQSKLRQQFGPVSIILWAGFTLGSIIGLHQGLRAMTRPVLYALIVFGLFTIIGRARARRRSRLDNSTLHVHGESGRFVTPKRTQVIDGRLQSSGPRRRLCTSDASPHPKGADV